jgi:hypothetical protein
MTGGPGYRGDAESNRSTSCGQAASGDCCHANFHCVARSIIIFQAWQDSGVWVISHRVHYEQARRHAGRAACPSVVIMDISGVREERAGD